VNDDPLKIKEGCGSCCLFLFAVFVLGPIVLVLLGMSDLLKLPTMDFSTIIIVGVGFGLWLSVMCELGQAKKRKEEAARKSAALLIDAPEPTPAQPHDSINIEALRKYLTGRGFNDHDPKQSSFPLWMGKDDGKGQPQFVVKVLHTGELHVSGTDNVDELQEEIRTGRYKEMPREGIKPHWQEKQSFNKENETPAVTKPTPSIVKNGTRFFIFKPGEEEAQGPFDISQIEALRVCGVVNEDTQFCREGQNEWMPSPVE
jgi:hypothetical protein